jgi:hypothetical protein
MSRTRVTGFTALAIGIALALWLAGRLHHPPLDRAAHPDFDAPLERLLGPRHGSPAPRSSSLTSPSWRAACVDAVAPCGCG